MSVPRLRISGVRNRRRAVSRVGAAASGGRRSRGVLRRDRRRVAAARASGSLAGSLCLRCIAVTVVITVLVVGKDSGGGESPTPTNGERLRFRQRE